MSADFFIWKHCWPASSETKIEIWNDAGVLVAIVHGEPAKELLRKLRAGKTLDQAVDLFSLNWV